MKVTAILPGFPKAPRAIDIYRITGAYTLINAHTNHTMTWYTQKDLRENERLIPEIQDSDLIVLQRMITAEPMRASMFCRLLRQKGATLVYETDDDLTGLFRPINPSPSHWGPPQPGASALPYLVEVDAITASTQVLADRMADVAGKPAYVIPNYLPLQWFRSASYFAYKDGKKAGRRERTYPGTLNLMLAGTPTHQEDWRPIVNVLPDLLADFPHLRVIFAGYKPDYVPDHERIVFMQPREYSGYPAMLFEADIVAAGLDPADPFNAAKSAVKALESWAAKRRLDGILGGAAFLGSDSNVYRDVVTDGKDGLLVEHTPDAWANAIRTLIENDALRHRLQRNGYRTVAKYALKQHYRTWLSVYKNIVRS